LADRVKIFKKNESRKFAKEQTATAIGAPASGPARWSSRSRLGEASGAAWVSVPSGQTKAVAGRAKQDKF
jgi:hypothetical protein